MSVEPDARDGEAGGVQGQGRPDPGPGEDGPPGRRRRPSRPSLGAEVVSAGRGLADILTGDPRWTRHFELTTAGFLRSFFGPGLALPLFVLGSSLVAAAQLDGKPVPPAYLWGTCVADLANILGFPLLIALIARPLRIGAGYAAFIIVTNWASLYLNALLAASSVMALLGHDGLGAYAIASLVLLCLSVFFIWRAGRLTLSREVAPVLLVVVLWVAVSAAADTMVQLFD